MSWSKASCRSGAEPHPERVEGRGAGRLLHAVFLSAALVATTSLAACSGLTPVYGERGIGVERHEFRYAKPVSRLEQIIYQELALRFGRSVDPAAPLVRITTSSALRDLTRTKVSRPSDQREAVVTARIELVDADGNVAFTATRSASALYTADSQALAETEAERDAGERAARELAETIRLTLLGTLANPA